MEKYRVNILYTAPTVLRTMAQFPEKNYRRYDLSSLRRLGSVGEHLDESTWQWYSRVIGRDTCPIVDTWWQTETGGILLATLPGIAPQKPGYSGLPLPGVVPQILKESGELVMTQPWPGLAATLFAQDQRFKDTYFPDSAVVYHTHDKAKIDPEGYVQLLGRNDDVLNISGHRVACAEVERAILESKAVVEAAVIGRPHPITGEEVCIFVVVPQESVVDLDELRDSLNRGVQAQIGRFIRLGPLYVAKELPKTRSGKILRRLLRQLVRGEEIGDTSVLANPEGFALLQQAYKNREN